MAPQVAPATQADNLAICCSGGGIRTAAYCLGALQSLGRAGLVAKARWILGVSGGGYVASSRALVARALPAGEKADAYAPGTPEERNLRNDTHYIAPNVLTILAGVLSLLIGAIVTFVIVAAPLYAFTHAWGWLLRWQDVLVPSGPHAMKAAATGTAWWLSSVIAAGITLPLFAYWWLTLEPPGRRRNARARWWAWLKPDGSDRSTNRAQIVSWAAALTVGLAAAMLAAPPLISWLTRSTGSFGTIARAVGFGAKPTWSFGALVGLIAAVAAIARSAQTGLARWNALDGQANGTAGQPGALGILVGAVRQKLLPWLASAVIVLGAAVLALLWISDGAQAGYSPGQLLPVAVALAVALLARVVVNVNRLSMHEFYRWRLASAFAVTRRAAQAQDPVKARALFAQAAATPLSALREEEGEASGPGLVICGMANINAEREVWYGHGDCCVAFDPEHVTLRGYTSQVAQALTSDYEALVGRRRSTLFDVSAISGAAISPLMGSATRHAYQILFAAANICLGVWLPHPSLIRDARNWLDQPDSYSVGAWWEQHPLLLLGWYLMPHPFWHRNADRNDQTRDPAVGPRARAQAGRKGGAVVPGHAADPRAEVGRGGWAAELPRHLDVCHRRRPLRQSRPGRGSAPRRQQYHDPGRLRRQGQHLVHSGRCHRPGQGRRRGGH